MNKYDYAVVIGRFSPFHNGHKYLIDQAFEVADKVIVVVGSADAPRNTQEPFTYEERAAMIYGVYPGKDIIVCGVSDTKYNDERWYGAVRQQVEQSIGGVFSAPEIAIVAHDKDSSSFYIHNFPDWCLVKVDAPMELSATHIRDMYFGKKSPLFSIENLVPDSVYRFLWSFIRSKDYEYLYEWFSSDRYNKKIWSGSPYPVTIVCADAVVTHSGNILLIKRGRHPGKDLWAMPGGHIDINEKIIDSAVRELKEETRIADEKGEIPPAMLKSFIDDSKTKTYDDPRRSTRGRVITTAFHFELPPKKKFTVRADDDAKAAKWFPINEIWTIPMFEDHRSILSDMLGV